MKLPHQPKAKKFQIYICYKNLMILSLISYHHQCYQNMTDKNPVSLPPDSPESDFINQWPQELSEYLKLDDDNQWPDDDDHPDHSFANSWHVLNQDNQTNQVGDFGGSSSNVEGSSTNVNIEDEKAVKEKVSFKTKSEVEILDDGFKWRKYGKKMVKNSPNPRNYYRCSVEGCRVKKRVERDRDDPSYVITTYEGTHTHPSSY
ncbi:probable WRKY transcription factor 50 isoform X2 [Lotus japonicus]|uniref:probable WRKY transcription factor 50 isoform X2 n=1 Tax=Lotus japonicus TaxID=34305 RepID=UPI0025902555|nr:probable WRKY transcription factor 50 isoform X2 [Lotus japonicus]